MGSISLLLLSRLVHLAPAADVSMGLRRIKPERLMTTFESLLYEVNETRYQEGSKKHQYCVTVR